MQHHTSQKFEMIFLDAAGTLFEVRESVGATYARLGAKFGMALSAKFLQEAFLRAYSTAPPLAFPQSFSSSQRILQEQIWWKRLVQNTCQEAGKAPWFDEYFEEVYHYFQDPLAWRVFEEVPATLQQLRAQGFRLGIISNFDTRLYPLLDGLDLRLYFEAVHLSSEIGVAKPNPEIFAYALRQHRLQPNTALHVGDSFREDVEGASAAGLTSLWLCREGAKPGPEDFNHTSARIASLDQIANFV